MLWPHAFPGTPNNKSRSRSESGYAIAGSRLCGELLSQFLVKRASGMGTQRGVIAEPPGPPGPTTRAGWENSDVLLPGSVAVAVRNCPRGTSVTNVAMKRAIPLASVITVNEP